MESENIDKGLGGTTVRLYCKVPGGHTFQGNTTQPRINKEDKTAEEREWSRGEALPGLERAGEMVMCGAFPQSQEERPRHEGSAEGDRRRIVLR